MKVYLAVPVNVDIMCRYGSAVRDDASLILWHLATIGPESLQDHPRNLGCLGCPGPFTYFWTTGTGAPVVRVALAQAPGALSR